MELVKEGFNVLISPPRIAVNEAIRTADIYLSCLFIAGNRISILTKIKHGYEVARAFTSHQLLTLLENAHHQSIFIEHDPSLFENLRDAEILALALRDTASRCETLVYYSAFHDEYLRIISRLADRIIAVTKHLPGYVADVIERKPRKEVKSFLLSDVQLTLEV